MDQYYIISKQPDQQLKMFTTILRIGPLVILEGILLAMAAFIYLQETLPQCYVYTLTEMAFIFFLIEMYACLRIIKKSPQMSKKYIKNRVQEASWLFYGRLIWDNLNIILVLMLLYSSLVADGVKLRSNSNHNGSNSNEPTANQCGFTLFSICLFSELLKECTFSAQDYMIVWMLYAATTFLISIICVILSKEYYQYVWSLHRNRKYYVEHGAINQALLDCKLYHISEETAVSQQIRHIVGECSICLNGLLSNEEIRMPQKIVQLKCRHHFHEECITKWIKVKDHCPFRCFTDQK